MSEPKITGGVYIPNWNWDKIVGSAKVDSKAQAEYDSKMAKYLQAKDTMLKNGWSIDSCNGGVISFSQVARRTIGADGKAVETIIPQGSGVQKFSQTASARSGQVGDLLVNYSLKSASPASTNMPVQRKQDFSEFANKDTLFYNSKTANDMDEARQTLLKAGYVKVGTDKDGKEYYEKRTSSAGNTNKQGFREQTSSQTASAGSAQVGKSPANYSLKSASLTSTSIPVQQEQDFSEFANKDTLFYNSKTANDMDEARQTLLKEGYVKVGTDKDGKEYYEKRTSSAENANEQT